MGSIDLKIKQRNWVISRTQS